MFFSPFALGLEWDGSSFARWPEVCLPDVTQVCQFSGSGVSVAQGRRPS